MRFLLLLLAIAIPTTFIWDARPAQAQRGQLIEDLFRTIANAQLEREQRKRAEAELAARQPGPLPQSDIPIQTPQSRHNRAGRGSGVINPRSREVAEFAQYLVNFDGAIDPLVREMRSEGQRNQSLRALLPDAYQVSADVRALIDSCDGLGSLQPLIEPYSQLDSHWRQLSFQLRALDGLSNQCVNSIRSCDQLVRTISGHLGLQPQFDRHALHDLMIVASTHMQTLLDDLQIARINQREVERLTHDCRILRQRLLSQADEINDLTYEQTVSEFNDFTTRWAKLSEQVYAIKNPYMNRRLERIRECGDQTYELLWIPPPYDAATLTASARHLEQSCGEILDQLTLRSMVALSPQDQVRMMESSRRLYRASKELAEKTTRGASQDELRSSFANIDKDWAYMRNACQQIQSINRATLTSIDQEVQHLAAALGRQASAVPALDIEQLIQVAAALEGSAEALDADINRLERYLQPAATRRSLTRASDAFLRHCRDLYRGLSHNDDMQRLQREAEETLDVWQQLSNDISQATQQLSPRRAQTLERGYEHIVPLVAQISASLIGR